MGKLEGLIAIDSGYFYAGLVHRDGIAIDAAPIIKYMIGWNGVMVRNYCKIKKWQIVKEREDEERNAP